MSRGLRNCNPGNIRLSPTKYMGEVTPSRDTAFKQFETMAWGYRAIFVLLDSYRRNGFRTIRQMITRYAPPVENETDVYIQRMIEWTELSADKPIDTNNADVMTLFVSAISRMENGKPAVDSDVLAGWNLFIKHKP